MYVCKAHHILAAPLLLTTLCRPNLLQMTRAANSDKLLSRCLKHGQTGSRIRAGKDGHFHLLYSARGEGGVRVLA